MPESKYRIDLHMHSTVSDGTDTPEELLKLTAEKGIQVFSVTDHDDVKAGVIIRGCIREGDPEFIQGAEFSCKDEKGKYHILGYGFDPNHPAISGLIDRVHSLRIKKVTMRIDLLKTEFGFTFPDEELKALFSLDNPGKPHIGNLMVKYGYAKTKEEAIKEYIDKLHFSAGYVRPENAIESILQSGGIPVLAHPFYGSGDELIIDREIEERLTRLIEFGLEGIEAYYSGFTSKLRRNALDLAKKYNLYVTAGSDYHGSNKLVKLGENGLEEETELPEGMRRFLDRFI